MGNKHIVKQMIDLQKKSFYNCFSTMVMFQDQAEKLLKDFIGHIPGVSDEGQKIMDQWSSAYKKSRNGCMKAVDSGYARLESLFDFSDSMVMLQDQTEKILKNFIGHVPGMSDEARKIMDQWNSTCNKSCDDFMKTVDDGYARLESFFDYNIKEMLKRGVPEDFKKSMEEVASMHKKNRNEFKKFIGENIQNLQNFPPVAKKQRKRTK